VFRRRRAGPETHTLFTCFNCRNLWVEAPCTAPQVDAFPLMTMATVRSPVDTTEVTNPSDKFLTVKGIKFTSIHTLDPNEAFGTGQILNEAFMIVLWEAIVVLPLQQGTTNVPAYVPLLTSQLSQSGDVADRVLWKRMTVIPYWGIGAASVPQLVDTSRFQPDGGAQVVKANCRLDDRHSLWYVRNFVHNIIPDTFGEFTNCVFSEGDNDVLPINNHHWFKIFYKTGK